MKLGHLEGEQPQLEDWRTYDHHGYQPPTEWDDPPSSGTWGIIIGGVITFKVSQMVIVSRLVSN